ncbi:seminal fluid protein HACP001 [Danaus plexippus plexippus]|uniref:Seminal fluid protein HACP001 n=2 Tax=Danaus plexippus TaxID=13037 RepID=A0A212FPG4_DANPL|nr:seminal fluid protein HACP001 [Danaus plexippus plexippus]
MRQKQKMFNYIIIYFILYNVSPGDLNKYDLIIIPILKDEGINENRKPRAFHRDYRTNYDRLDIGDYEEATEALDVDSFGDTSSTLDVSGLTGSGPQRLGLDYPLGNYEEDKIVGGFEVDINLYPYHVAYGTNCGGAIIDRKWIITAGHCG